MSLLKRVIKSFRKLFQFKKTSRKKKSNPPRKKKISRKKVKKSKQLRKSHSAQVTSAKKKVNQPVAKQRIQKTSSDKLKPLPTPPVTIKKLKQTLPEAPQGKFIGDITHYFTRIKVIVLEVKNGPIKVGDRILIKGSKSNFTQTVKSMQIESVEVKSAQKGQIIGLQVTQDSQVGDKVFLLK